MLRLSPFRICTFRQYTTAAKRQPFQIAIDGPAASGKSTTAKMVAQRLEFDYIDTGAFYRCGRVIYLITSAQVTLAALSKGIDPSDPVNAGKVSAIAQQARIGLETIFPARGPSSLPSSTSLLPTTRVFLDSKDVSAEIRTGNVSKYVSAVAAIGDVRDAVLNKVRNIGAVDDENVPTSNQTPVKAGLVMDGRDIGTVVLPNANLKIFLVADSRVRAERRLEELIRNGADPTSGALDVEEVRKDLERRDTLDRTRKISPLKKAADAVELDTSHLTIEGQVDAIVALAQARRR
ncbi:hypothetical protein BGZ94_006408 [Podila epigama]|nr:hypothetical protein BGZ94_006408 [Podila epigama]